MILTAHQCAYLPWLGYFHKIAISDIFVILDEVQFEKNSFINRNKIKTANGEMWISVPMKMIGHMTKTIKDMEINNKFNWREKHWKSIYLNYKKAPYFNRHSDFLKCTYDIEWNSIVELTNHMTRYFLNELGIKTKVINQSEMNTKLKKQELIVEMCKNLSADKFIFGKLGKDYAQEAYFKDNNIDIYFQNFKHPEYNQLWGNFIPNMSIIDLILNVSKDEALETIMTNNITKNDLLK